MLLLHHVRVRTGREPHIVVAASNCGAPHDPDWYHDLLARPRVVVGAEVVTVDATEVTGAERDELCGRLARMHLSRWPRAEVVRIVADGTRAVVEFRGVGGLGRNGTDYNLEYCWAIRVVDDLVREVVGYDDRVKVNALFHT